MNEIVISSMSFGIVISIIGYQIGLYLKNKFKSPLLNPLLISIIFIISFMLLFDISYESYMLSAKYLSFLLTPATVCLAIPLYMQITLLKENMLAITLGVLSGVITSLFGIFVFATLFQLNHQEYITLLPKSITTAIAIGLVDEFGGYSTITAVAIMVTGIFGNIVAESVLKVFRITNPIAKGIAIGTSSHIMGTTKAIEIGEIEGAMSGLSIVVAGIFTLVGMSVFATLY